MSAAERCDLTDLLVAQCAHCQGHPDLGTQRARLGLGSWITASRSGPCSECELGIREGDSIRADGDGGWLCQDCGVAANGWTP